MSKTPDQVEEFNVYNYLKQLIDGNDVGVLLRVADEVVSVMDVLHFYVPTIDQVSNGLRLALNLIRKYLPEGAFSRIYLDRLGQISSATRKFDSQYLGHTHSEIIRNIKLVFRCDEEDIIDFRNVSEGNDQHLLYIQD